MKATVDPIVLAKIEAIKTVRKDAKESKDIRAAAKKVLLRNLGDLDENGELYARLSDCSYPTVVKGETVKRCNRHELWNKFHGADYPDIFDEESDRTREGQFFAAVVSCVKDIVADSSGSGDRETLAAWIEFMEDDLGFSLKAGGEVKRRITGDYAAKRFFENRYGLKK